MAKYGPFTIVLLPFIITGPLQVSIDKKKNTFYVTLIFHVTYTAVFPPHDTRFLAAGRGSYQRGEVFTDDSFFFPHLLQEGTGSYGIWSVFSFFFFSPSITEGVVVPFFFSFSLLVLY